MKTIPATATLSSYMASFIDNANTSYAPKIEDAVKAFKFVVLKKNEYLVQEKQVCTHFCFLESGVLQHAIEVAGEEKTTYLALRNSVTSSLSSFLNQTPSRKSIKAIVDSKLWVIDLNVFKDLIAHNDGFQQFYHNLIEKQICLIDEYRIDLLTLTPEERYNKLLQTEPKLLQEVPLHYLASFLGISTRHMSRIRTNIK
jgi:CRP-like cAMP-binding protein